MQPMRFEIVPSPLTVEPPIEYKDGQTKRRERRERERKARK
jgi:hypothetical protein